MTIFTKRVLMSKLVWTSALSIRVDDPAAADERLGVVAFVRFRGTQ